MSNEELIAKTMAAQTLLIAKLMKRIDDLESLTATMVRTSAAQLGAVEMLAAEVRELKGNALRH